LLPVLGTRKKTSGTRMLAGKVHHPEGNAGLQVIVKNTFLDFESRCAEELPESQRKRAVSDLTDTKLPWKVPLHGDDQVCQISRHRLASTLGSDESGPSSPIQERAAGLLLPVAEDSPIDSFLDEGKGRSVPPVGPALPWSPAGGVFPFPTYGMPWWGNNGMPMTPMPGMPRWGMPLFPNNGHMPSPHGNGHMVQKPNKKGKAGFDGTRARLQLAQHIGDTTGLNVNGGSSSSRSNASNNNSNNSGNHINRNNISNYNNNTNSNITINGNSSQNFSQHHNQTLNPSQNSNQSQIGSDRAARGIAAKPKNSEQPVTTNEPTTVMLRNIPNRYTSSTLLALLDERGFRGLYDFVYLPMDFQNGVNLGYAFVNLLVHEDALTFKSAFHGFDDWLYDSAKVSETSWAHPHQGLAEHVERYRNSPVMHPCMPDEYKPMVFHCGMRVPFPMPTKAIKAPKLRASRDRPQMQGATCDATKLPETQEPRVPDLVSVCA